jgi:hypothetical protein
MKVQRAWEQDIPENIAKANGNWPALNPSRNRP